MKTLYESILSSTGSGKAFLKNELLKDGWKMGKTLLSGPTMVNDKYHAQSEFLQIREDGSLYVDIHAYSSKVIYRYDILDYDDLRYVTNYWTAYNNVYLKGFNSFPAKQYLKETYQILRRGLKPRFIRKL